MKTYKINTPEGLREFLKFAPEMSGFKFCNPTDEVSVFQNKADRPVVSAQRVSIVNSEGAAKLWMSDISGILPPVGEIGAGLIVVEEYGSTSIQVWDCR